MIVISSDHNRRIQKLLKGYQKGTFDSVLRQIAPILREYYPTEPVKISKRLLQSLFSGWLSKAEGINSSLLDDLQIGVRVTDIRWNILAMRYLVVV